MSNPEIKKEWDTEHGHIVSGILFDEARRVEVPYWRGIPHSEQVPDYIVGKTGLTADLRSLKIFGEVALELGVKFVTVGHKHKNVSKAIKENSQDVQFAVAHHVPEEVRLHGAGLSRGWAGMLLAAKHMPGRFSSLTAIAPAMMAPVSISRTWRIGAEIARETARSPREFGSVLLDSVNTVRKRLGITISEAAKVGIGGFVHERVNELAARDNDIAFHLAACEEDCWYDPEQMSRIAHELGFTTYTLFDEGSAGHSALAYHPKLSESVIATAIEDLPNRDLHTLSRPTHENTRAA